MAAGALDQVHTTRNKTQDKYNQKHTHPAAVQTLPECMGGATRTSPARKRSQGFT